VLLPFCVFPDDADTFLFNHYNNLHLFEMLEVQRFSS